MFATALRFHPSLTFVGKARSLPLEWSPVKDPHWQAPVLFPNTRLGWKRMTGANTPAYFDTAIITSVKGFIAEVIGCI